MHVIFLGNVQGVGFRATVRHLANQLGVTGSVRNKENGSVELYAQGTKDILNKLIADIQAEFEPYIKSTSVNFGPVEQLETGFNIVR